MRTPELRRAVLIGVSYMIPFVVVGGILQAAGLILGGRDLAGDPAAALTGTLLHQPGGAKEHLAAFAYTLGSLCFHLLAPVLAAAIAYAIAERPGLMPGLVTGLAAATVGAGYLGALVGGVLAGLVAEQLARIPARQDLRGLSSMLLVPLVATLACAGAMLAIVGPPVAAMSATVNGWLSGLGGVSLVLMGAVAAVMMVADLGGPLNKTAYTFAVAGVTGAGTVHGPAVMAAVMAAGMTAPLACWLATTLRPSRFSPAERRAGRAAGVSGALFITEGAIPFAATKPVKVLPALMAGATVTGVLSTMLGATLTAPHGGVLVLADADKLLALLMALLLGTVTAAGGLLIGRSKFAGPAADVDSENASRVSEAASASALRK